MLFRVLVTTKVTISHTFVVDGVPTDAVGDVTATAKRLDGSAYASGTAAHPGDPGLYTFEVPASPVVDTVSLDWSGNVAGAAVVVRDYIEMVGGFYFGLDRARKVYREMQSTTRYTDADLVAARTRIEWEADRIAGVAFVPRFGRYLLTGSGRRELILPRTLLRTVRAVSVDGTAWSNMEVTGLRVSASGILTRLFGSIWPAGAPVIIECEHGMDFCPPDVEDAAALRLRSVIGAGSGAIPDRAVSYSITDGGVYRLGVAGPRSTGIPDVDAAYKGYEQLAAPV